MAKKNHSFKGALAKPIRVQLPAKPLRKEFESEEKYERALHSYNNYCLNERLSSIPKRYAKLPLLLNHYGLANDCSEGNWMKLAIKLAEDCVPGFKIEIRKSVGRKKDWDAGIQAVLYFSVKKIILESETSARKKNVSDACKILAKKDFWKNLGIQNVKTLQNHYTKSKDSPMVKEFESMRRSNHGEQKEFELVYCDIVTGIFSPKLESPK